MMKNYKVCVISDSHGSKQKLENLIFDSDFDYIFFLGDGLKDVEDIQDDKIKKVSGNCDLFSMEDSTISFVLNNVKILLTHGHLFNVKWGLNKLLEYAKKQSINLVCFGHTHKQFLQIAVGVTLLNPGSFKDGKYAVLNIKTDGSFGIDFKDYD